MTERRILAQCRVPSAGPCAPLCVYPSPSTFDVQITIPTSLP